MEWFLVVQKLSFTADFTCLPDHSLSQPQKLYNYFLINGNNIECENRGSGLMVKTLLDAMSGLPLQCRNLRGSSSRGKSTWRDVGSNPAFSRKID